MEENTETYLTVNYAENESPDALYSHGIKNCLQFYLREG